MVTPTYLWMVMDQTSVNSSCCLSTLTPFVSFKCDMLVENGYTMWGIFTKAWTYVIVLIKLLNCRFSLLHHHQNYSTNKVKNQRGKRRWILNSAAVCLATSTMSSSSMQKKLWENIILFQTLDETLVCYQRKRLPYLFTVDFICCILLLLAFITVPTCDLLSVILLPTQLSVATKQ